MTVLVPLGTRPEIIKLAPVVEALRQVGLDPIVAATGQHADPALTEALFDGLGFSPDVVSHLPTDSEEDRIGGLFAAAWKTVADTKPTVVLTLGDTYTVPAFALAARRHRVPMVHLEAGLRSFNPTSMEEVNRRVAAALASLHLAPTELAAHYLQHEGVAPERIEVVGNPIIDVLAAAGRERAPLSERRGIVVTAHRATNVDDPDRLAALVRIVRALAAEAGPVHFPLHPRTRSRLEAAGTLDDLLAPGVNVVEPLPWDEMLDLLASVRLVVTDSGGLQEEASYFGVPTIVLRRSTPRWEGVATGASVLTGLDEESVLASARTLSEPAAQARVAALPCPYGDGRTSARVAAILADPATAELLRIEEPDLRAGPPRW